MLMLYDYRVLKLFQSGKPKKLSKPLAKNQKEIFTLNKFLGV